MFIKLIPLLFVWYFVSTAQQLAAAAHAAAAHAAAAGITPDSTPTYHATAHPMWVQYMNLFLAVKIQPFAGLGMWFIW